MKPQGVSSTVIRKYGLGLLALMLAGSSLHAQAPSSVNIKIYSTGLDNRFNPLPSESRDPHYVIISAPAGTAATPFLPYVVSTNRYPLDGSWLADGAASQWVGPQASYSTNCQDPIGDYDYRTTFDLTGLNPASATLTFQYIADNVLEDLQVNGKSAGLSIPPESGLTAWSGPIEITSGFVSGSNALDFIVYNQPPFGCNPSGLRVQISGTASNSATIAPAITQQPASVITNQDATVALSATATGTVPLSYQWSLNGTNIFNSTSSALFLPSVEPSNAGLYSVTVANVAGSTTSSIAFLAVITQQPFSVITNQGSTVTFTVEAVGSPFFTLSYQWQFNGVPISWATGSSLTLSNTDVSNIGDYSVIVWNPAASFTTSNASLTVITPPVIVPPSITNQPLSVITNQGSNATFVVGAAGSPQLAYQWRINGTNISGATGSSYTVRLAATTNIGYYSVVVSNAAGTTNSVSASLTFLDFKRYAGLTVNSPIVTNYAIQATETLDGTDWTTLNNAALSNQASLYLDYRYNTLTNANQFYRAIPQP